MNDEINKAISEALDPADIRAAILAEAEKQNATSQQLAADQQAAEKAAADKLAAEEAAKVAVAATFKRTEVIGGKSFAFEAGSELELERLVTSAYKVAFSVQPEPQKTTVDPAIAAAEAKRVAEEEAAAKAELELEFKRGDISAADYIERSGAMKQYLEKQGVSLDKLKAVLDEKQNKAYTASWEEATESFKTSAAGQDWPGGTKNTEQLGLIIVSLGLTDAEDKVAALAQAYAKMKSTGMIFANEEAAATPTAAATTTDTPAAATVAAPAASAAPAPTRASTSSSLFGASSGTSGSGSTGAAPAAAAAAPVVDPNASPQEILAAWKEATLKSGKDPNAAFTEAFANGRRA